MDQTRHAIRKLLTESDAADVLRADYWILPDGEVVTVEDSGWNHEAAALAVAAEIDWGFLSASEQDIMDETFDGPWYDVHADIARKYAKKTDFVARYMNNPEQVAIRDGWIRVTDTGGFDMLEFDAESLRRIQTFLLDRGATKGKILLEYGSGYMYADVETVLLAKHPAQVTRQA